MNSRTRRLAPAHRAATRLAADSRCLLCERIGCVPAHWPVHRGLGGGKAGWSPREWVPLCPPHHDLIDGRAGVSEAIEAERAAATLLLRERAEEWWGDAH